MTRARPPRVQRSGRGQGESSTPARAPARTPPPPDALRSCTWGRRSEREDQRRQGAKREQGTTRLLSRLHQQGRTQCWPLPYKQIARTTNHSSVFSRNYPQTRRGGRNDGNQSKPVQDVPPSALLPLPPFSLSGPNLSPPPSQTSADTLPARTKI